MTVDYGEPFGALSVTNKVGLPSKWNTPSNLGLYDI